MSPQLWWRDERAKKAATAHEPSRRAVWFWLNSGNYFHILPNSLSTESFLFIGHRTQCVSQRGWEGGQFHTLARRFKTQEEELTGFLKLLLCFGSHDLTVTCATTRTSRTRFVFNKRCDRLKYVFFLFTELKPLHFNEFSVELSLKSQYDVDLW